MAEPIHRNAQQLLATLVAALGSAAVTPGSAVPARYQSDWSGAPPVAPLALVRPASTEQAVRTLQLCQQWRVPVVPQGGMTGLAGAGLPLAEGVVVSLERMAAIEQVCARTGVLRAQAGASLQSIQQAASAAGMVFGVDLGARGSCQIGGNVATNAGGNGVLQYGMMREQVLGLEVVLASGEVLPMLRPMLKNNTGYDLKQCFIGAEGTLGLITRVLLRLHPAPQARATALLALTNFDAALALLQRLRAAFPARLAAFELMWQSFIDAALRWQRLAAPFERRYPMVALVDVDGNSAEQLAGDLADVLGQALHEGLLGDAVLAQSDAQARQLWKIREATTELPSHMHPPINFDISLPLLEVGRFVQRCQQCFDARWPGHHTVCFGHIGDGNLHVTTDSASIQGDEAALERALYGLVQEFAGSISAEHGIGLHKKPYLKASRSQAEIAAMQAIKKALDPLNLMNPGKVFDANV